MLRSNRSTCMLMRSLAFLTRFSTMPVLELQIGEIAHRFADQAHRAGQHRLARDVADVGIEHVGDGRGGHGELAHGVVVGADRGLHRLVERDARGDAFVGGVRPGALPAGAEELRLDHRGQEIVHLGCGDVGGGRGVLGEAEKRQEAGIEGGLVRRARRREIVDRLDVGVDAGETYARHCSWS